MLESIKWHRLWCLADQPMKWTNLMLRVQNFDASPSMQRLGFGLLKAWCTRRSSYKRYPIRFLYSTFCKTFFCQILIKFQQTKSICSDTLMLKDLNPQSLKQESIIIKFIDDFFSWWKIFINIWWRTPNDQCLNHLFRPFLSPGLTPLFAYGQCIY